MTLDNKYFTKEELVIISNHPELHKDMADRANERFSKFFPNSSSISPSEFLVETSRRMK